MEISVFCDESCHLQHDGHDIMVLGAVWCARSAVRDISYAIRELKRSYGLAMPSNGSRGFEIKWSKVSPARVEFYKDLIKLFISEERLHFRGVIVPNKVDLYHGSHAQTHDDFYYKTYYNLLIRLLDDDQNNYNIYLDIKDTRGGPKTRKLHDYLSARIQDHDNSIVKNVQQIRSDESELLQLCDLIIGAISYLNREESTSTAKLEVIDALRSFGRTFPRNLSETSFLSERKVNLLRWRPAGGK